MKKTKIIVFAFLVVSLSGLAQIGYPENKVAVNYFKSIPQESTFLHYNTNLLFTGEQLLYKLYCFNDGDKKFSQISQIGYVELIAKDRSVVFKHKIKLHNGLGNGDYFIPLNVPTGSYKIFAYTHWMQNKGYESFFEGDLFIINPYQKVPEEYLRKTKDTLNDKKSIEQNIPLKKPLLKKSLTEVLTLNKVALGKRKKLEITLDSIDKGLSSGNYSLSVRRLERLITQEAISATFFSENHKSKSRSATIQDKGLFYLPELRGELISGVIVNKESETPVSGEKIALSIPGSNYTLKASTTDSQGRFYYNLDTNYSSSSAILLNLSGDWKQNAVSLYQSKVDYEGLQFKSLFLDFSMKKEIEERSIQNQIENAYIALKLDKKLVSEVDYPFYGKLETVYDLDDYTRFNAIEETIIEIVNQVRIKRKSKGERIFQVLPKDGLRDAGFPALLFVDGVFIKRHEDIMEYGARKIKTIGFSKDVYFIESLAFQGVISITTIDGDYNKNLRGNHHKVIDLFEPQKEKVYFRQDYESKTADTWKRIPDFRRQLLWIPDMQLKSKQTIELFTSDISGDYEISLEGFSSDGLPISISKTFSVE